MDDPKATEQETNNDSDIEVAYANNILIQSSVWDLKTVFGEYDNTKNSVDWHTSVTMPWPTAALLAYYLQVNLIIFAQYNHAVKVPISFLPPLPPAPSSELIEKDPHAKIVYERIAKLHASFLEQFK